MEGRNKSLKSFVISKILIFLHYSKKSRNRIIEPIPGLNLFFRRINNFKLFSYVVELTHHLDVVKRLAIQPLLYSIIILSCPSTPVSVLIQTACMFLMSLPRTMLAKLTGYTLRSRRAPPASSGLMILSCVLILYPKLAEMLTISPTILLSTRSFMICLDDVF